MSKENKGENLPININSLPDNYKPERTDQFLSVFKSLDKKNINTIYMKNKTPLMCVLSEEKSIGKIIRDESKGYQNITKDVRWQIKDWMGWLMDVMYENQPHKALARDQILECVNTIVDEYRSLKMSDVALIITRIKNGGLKTFGAITTPDFLGFVKDYFDERCYAIENRNMENNNAFKLGERDVPRMSRQFKFQTK